MRIYLCMHSEPGNSQNFWVGSATLAVAVTGMQQRSSHMTGGEPSSATCCNWPVQWEIGALCVVTENTTVQLLTLGIKPLPKLTCK